MTAGAGHRPSEPRRDFRSSGGRAGAGHPGDRRDAPGLPNPEPAIEEQAQLAQRGAFLERCVAPAYTGKVDWERMFVAIRATGSAHSVLSTELGQPANRPIEDGLAIIADRLLAAGFMDVDVAVRDLEELRALGLPIWARWVRGAAKTIPDALQVPVTVGGATIRPGDIIVLDADGAVVVAAERAKQELQASREARETELRGLSSPPGGSRSIACAMPCGRSLRPPARMRGAAHELCH